MLLEVLFENSRGEKRVIGTVDEEVKEFPSNDISLPKSFKVITDFLDDHNFTSYYSRIVIHQDYYWVDVGSHTEFFYIQKVKEGNKNDLS